jgi:hypothetical protein
VPVILATWGSTNRRIIVQGCLGIKQNPISKITKAKRAGGVVQVVECLPSKYEALSFIPIIDRAPKQKPYRILS